MTAQPSAARVVLVDPSRFTAPYDAALSAGLTSNGVEHWWAVRRVRPSDRDELPEERTRDFFYRSSDESSLRLRQLRKGLEHCTGLAQLVRESEAWQANVIHFQWTVLPALDALAMLRLRKRAVIVATVHDTVPFNGGHISWAQRIGFDVPLKLADRLVVHTQAARNTLIARGLSEEKVSVIGHGPLPLACPVRPPTDPSHQEKYTLTLFGELKPYKGLDRLIEALAHLSAETVKKLRILVAGRPRMDLAPLQERINELGLSEVFEFRAYRLSEEEMGEVFSQTDCFIFPYRQIDASGVYYLVKSLGRWIIASQVGIFAEDLQDGVDGKLVDPHDGLELARAIESAVRDRPSALSQGRSDSWEAIGGRTRALYEDALRERADSALAGT